MHARNGCKQHEYRCCIIQNGTQSHASGKGWGWLATILREQPKGSRLRRRMMNPLLCLLATWSLSFAGATPLDDYVNAPDDTYRYEDLGDPYIGDGFRSHFINLTSQTWLTRERLRDRPCTDWNESVETFSLLCKFLNCSLRRCMSFFNVWSARDVDRSVWWHYLVINIPDVIEFPDKAFIYVTGGSNTDGLVLVHKTSIGIRLSMHGSILVQ